MKQLAIFLVLTLVVVNANPFYQSLTQVNEVRSNYNLHPLKWDTQLARQAASVASTCSQHTQAPANTKATFGASIVKKIAQESNYNCAADECTGGECDSFRELVSEQNTHIGCGFSLCNERPFIVCLYNKQHATASRRFCRTKFSVNKRDVSQTTDTTDSNNFCYIDGTTAILTARKNEAVRIAEDLNSQVTNALDKVMLTTGANDTNFCPLVNFVLGLQQNVSNMNIQIETNYICNQCQFSAIWLNLANLYAYRKRTITSNIVVNYTDTGCQRTITQYGIGAHFGRLNYLPTAPNVSFPGPPWHTTLNFWDSDRFIITYQEEVNNPGTFKIVGLVQYTEATFPLPEGTTNYTGGLVPGRSPFLVPAPGNYNVALGSSTCPCFAPPQTVPCT